MTRNWIRKPAAATARHSSTPKRVATTAPSAAPIGRAPNVAVVMKAETRPSMAFGVTGEGCDRPEHRAGAEQKEANRGEDTGRYPDRREHHRGRRQAAERTKRDHCAERNTARNGGRGECTDHHAGAVNAKGDAPERKTPSGRRP